MLFVARLGKQDVVRQSIEVEGTGKYSNGAAVAVAEPYICVQTGVKKDPPFFLRHPLCMPSESRFHDEKYRDDTSNEIHPH